MRAFAALAILTGCVAGEEPVPIVDINGVPACASAQLTAIFDQTRSVIPKGSVSDEHFVTARNQAHHWLLLDGPRIFPAFRELIAAAKRDVNLQTYVWEPSTEPATDILAGLADLSRRRAAAGATEPVTVRFLFDVSTLGYGSRVDALPKTWASVVALKLDPKYVKFELAGVVRSALGALHKKTLVVDGSDAIITGANPQAHHDYATPWRDAGYRFSGEVVQALEDDFDDTWDAGKRWTCGAENRELSACTTPTEPIVRGPAPTIALASDTCQPMLVVTRQADTSPGSNSVENPQDKAFIAAFGAATEHIHIQTPNLNDDAAKQAIVDAVVRGVQVDIVLSKGFNDASESYVGQGGTNAENVVKLYDALEARGVTSTCDKLRFRWHARNRVAIDGNGIYANHAKYASLDDTIVIVGTANMDTQSWNNSREINVIVDDPAITKAWDEQMFLRDFASGVQVDPCK